MTDMWTAVAEQRRALADDLADLPADAWDRPSWCEGWTIEDVVAHLCGTASTTPLSFVVGLARSRFRFDDFFAGGIARNKGASPAETLARLRSLADSRDAPPGPKTSWLGEVLVHAQDIRGPLGIGSNPPIDAVREVADFYKGSNLVIGAKKRIDGLQLRATDTPWVHGEGAPVEGRLMDLVMAMAGRAEALDQLAGSGVETLRERCS